MRLPVYLSFSGCYFMCPHTVFERACVAPKTTTLDYGMIGGVHTVFNTTLRNTRTATFNHKRS